MGDENKIKGLKKWYSQDQRPQPKDDNMEVKLDPPPIHIYTYPTNPHQLVLSQVCPTVLKAPPHQITTLYLKVAPSVV